MESIELHMLISLRYPVIQFSPWLQTSDPWPTLHVDFGSHLQVNTGNSQISLFWLTHWQGFPSIHGSAPLTLLDLTPMDLEVNQLEVCFMRALT